MSDNSKNLLNNAKNEGEISNDVFNALITIPDIGTQIQAGLGISVDDVPASEVFLLTLLTDDSSSMDINSDVAIEGYNLMLDSLDNTKEAENTLIHARYFHGKVLCPYIMLAQTPRMSKRNYQATGPDTPLYDQTIITLGTVVAKAQEFSERGVAVRTATYIVTDGAENSSKKARAKQIALVVKEMLKKEIHLVGAMGIDDGYTDFRKVFNEMGIEDKWILTPANTPSEIRKAFRTMSRSALRASQVIKPGSLGGFNS